MRRLSVVLALAALLAVSGCGADSERQSADTQNGKELFVQGPGEGQQPCGSCHTLADAATVSTVGPSLDNAFARLRAEGFEESVIYEVTLAQIDIPAPPMPADIVTGQDARDVAAYVALVAGKPPGEENAQGQSGEGTTTMP